MIIDKTKYRIPIENYIVNETIKKIIVIGHTNNRDMRHVKGWLHRHNGNFKKTAAFTIDLNGSVYRHFDPKFHSRYFNCVELDTKTIVILLENEGFLVKDEIKNEFITWIGDIYNKPNEIVEKKWRGQEFWAPYSDEQIESAYLLIKQLCDEFFIPIKPIGHNTKISDLLDEKTILYKSNLDKNYTDLSPSWDFNNFKNKLELK